MEIVSINGSDTDDRQDHKESVTSVTLKGSVFTLPIVKLHLSDLAQISRDLQIQLDTAQGFFKDSPVIIDLSKVRDHTVDFTSLKILLNGYALVPVGIQGGSEAQQRAAISQGLGIIPLRKKMENLSRRIEDSKAVQQADSSNDGLSEIDSAENDHSANEQSQEAYAEATQAEETHAEETQVASQPIRSGQRLYAMGGDIIQLAAVNAGAEIMADGNIHIYAPMRGRALAGVNGNVSARIFCHSFEAELVAVAGNYRVFEDKVPTDLFKKSVEIYLDQEQLIIRPLN